MKRPMDVSSAVEVRKGRAIETQGAHLQRIIIRGGGEHLAGRNDRYGLLGVDLVTGPLRAGLPGVGLGVADDLLLGRVPGELVAGPAGSRCSPGGRWSGPGDGSRRRRRAPSGRGMHSKKFAMWPSTGLPLRSSFRSDSGTGILVERIDRAAVEVDPVAGDEDLAVLRPRTSRRSRCRRGYPASTPLANLAWTRNSVVRVVAVVDGRIARLELDREHALDDLDRVRARSSPCRWPTGRCRRGGRPSR